MPKLLGLFLPLCEGSALLAKFSRLSNGLSTYQKVNEAKLLEQGARGQSSCRAGAGAHAGTTAVGKEHLQQNKPYQVMLFNTEVQCCLLKSYLQLNLPLTKGFLL